MKRPTRMMSFSETLNHGTWTADQSAGFQPTLQTTTNCFYISERHMKRARLKYLFKSVSGVLSGVLAMGVGGHAYPFSFAQRGMPQCVSVEIQAVFNAYKEKTTGHSWVTRDELVRKVNELMIIDEPDALEARAELLPLIQALPEHKGDPKDQRVVLWFDK